MFQNCKKKEGNRQNCETDIAKTREIVMHSNCLNEFKMTLQKFVKRRSLRDLTKSIECVKNEQEISPREGGSHHLEAFEVIPLFPNISLATIEFRDQKF